MDENKFSGLPLVFVQLHVFCPVVRENLSGETLLLLDSELQPLLVFQELLVFFAEADAHVVFVSLGVLLREAQTVDVWLRRFLDDLIDLFSTLTWSDKALSQRFRKRNRCGRLDHGFAVKEFFEVCLDFHFINNTLERVRFCLCQVCQDFAVQLDI